MNRTPKQVLSAVLAMAMIDVKQRKKQSEQISMGGTAMKKLGKTVALILSSLMAVTAFYGCESKSVGSGTSSVQKAMVNIYQFQVETNDEVVATAKNYMKENPNVTVTVQTVGGSSDYGSSLRAKMASGDQPEIIQLSGPSDLVEWKDSLEDLSDQSWVKDLLPSVKDDSTLNGKTVAFPYSTLDYGIIYNKQMFADAGIDMNGVDTFEKIDAAFGKLKQKIDSGAMKNKYPSLEAVMAFPAKESWVSGNHSSNIALAPELGTAMKALNAKTINFTYASELKDYIDLMVKYTKYAKNPSALNAVDYSTALDQGFATERDAAIQMGQWVVPEINKIDPTLGENLGLLPIPLKGVQEGNIVAGVGGLWVINKNSSSVNKSAAKKFLQWWWCTKDGQKEYKGDIILSGLKNPPVEPNNVISIAGEKYIASGKVTPVVFTGYPSGWPDKLSQGIQSYLSGTKTWGQVIQQAKDDWAKLRSN